MPKKHDDAKADEKLLKFYLYLLFATDPVPRAKVMDYLNCSAQTLTRLANKLKGLLTLNDGEFGEKKIGRNTYYYLERSSKAQRVPLDPEGLRQMELCRDFMIKLLPADDREKLKQTINKARTNLSNREFLDYENVTVGCGLSKGFIDYTPFQDQIRKFENCIIKKQTCLVTYKKSMFEDEKVFAVAPVRLVAYHESLYVLGWVVSESGHIMVKKNKPVNLCVHRTVKVEPQRGRIADRLPAIDDANNENFGVIRGEKFNVKILFSKDVSTYVGDRVWSHDQKFTINDDGSSVLEFSSGSEYEVIAFVMGFGRGAQIIEPLHLRDRIKEELVNTLDNYQ